MYIKVLNNFVLGENHLGKAVFAARNYKKNDVIVKFQGAIVHKSKIPKKMEGEKDRFVQIGKDNYLGPSGEIDDFINHSCDPNAGLRFSDAGVLLIALKNIKIGEEIAWDYSTTLYENPWKMLCDCKKSNCRKIIADFMTLQPSIQKKYYTKGIVPDYIREYMESPQYLVYTKGIESLRKHARKQKK